MIELIVNKNDKGQRLDKLLKRKLPNAPQSLIYKQLRKKNITLNGNKCDGSEITELNDTICLYFSDETYAKFSGSSDSVDITEYKKAYKNVKGIEVIYEDDDIIALNKPAGVLTQKATVTDVSLNEWLVGYLLNRDKISDKSLISFKPSCMNRLDRNTSGIVLAGVSLPGSRVLAKVIKTRDIKKYYTAYVVGKTSDMGKLRGYISKDTSNNIVSIKESISDSETDAYDPIATDYKLIRYTKLNDKIDYSVIEVELITGKSHQIRAHMASIGHPILGDVKYGDKKVNDILRESYGIKNQMLHAKRVEFPESIDELEELNNLIIKCEEPKVYGNLEK